MSTRKKKDVRAAAQVHEETGPTETPESTADAPQVASTRAHLWIMLMLLLPLSVCLIWGAVTR